MSYLIKILSFFIFSFYFTQSIYSQENVKVVGKVISTNTEPIQDVFVNIDSQLFVTDVNGLTVCELMKNSEYVFVISSLQYETIIDTFFIQGDTTLTFILHPLTVKLPEISIESDNNSSDLRRLRSIEGGGLYEGKKSDVIRVRELKSNKATNNARQIFAKIPNINIWESDNAGLQLDIGGRGLSPKRTSNFNTRQNGYDMSADALGYPESYYTPPIYAVKNIELVRGAAALQYGTQFGGMINFNLKEGNPDKKIEIESFQSYGNNNFFNSYNALNGQIGKFNYYTYGYYKRGDGWRNNSKFEQIGAYFSGKYKWNNKSEIGVDFTHMNYLSQQAGGLTDEAFTQDPKQSNRERNWFKVNWNLASIHYKHHFSKQATFYSKFFGLYAQRASLGLLETPDLPDPMSFRDLLDGNFKNYGNESKFIYTYNGKASIPNAVLIGTRIYRGNTNFKQNFGTDGFEADFTPVDTAFFNRKTSDFQFPNTNLALFVENIVRVSDKLSFVPGIRMEYINTQSAGFYTNTIKINAFDDFIVETIEESSEANRFIFLYGLGISNKINKKYELYGNVTSNYRAINFTDIQVQTNIQVVDPDITDESGYSFDMGLRKRTNSIFFFETGLYYIIYNNRIGEIIDDGLRVRTNIGSARIIGLELLFEIDLFDAFKYKIKRSNLSFFVNGSINYGFYTKISERALVGVQSGNLIEDLPIYNLKNGLQYSYRSFQVNTQFSLVGKQFSDAANTRIAFKGTFGEIPAYHVADVTATYQINKNWNATFSVNNVFNTFYFTRRAVSYPGPGIIPALGRTWNISIGFTL